MKKIRKTQEKEERRKGELRKGKEEEESWEG